MKANLLEKNKTQLETIRAKLEAHRSAERPVLLLSLADALWRPARVASALLAFAPCLGSVDLSWTPRLGVDVYQANEFHVQSSLQGYGQVHDPRECCQYDVAAAQCTQAPGALYRGADADVRTRAMAVQDWLQREIEVSRGEE